jgi:hypothetical protein
MKSVMNFAMPPVGDMPKFSFLLLGLALPDRGPLEFGADPLLEIAVLAISWRA